MRKILFIAILIISGCGLSVETKILARRIANSSKTQEIGLAKKFQGDQSPEAVKLIERAKKLSDATSGLADILGAPKEIE